MIMKGILYYCFTGLIVLTETSLQFWNSSKDDTAINKELKIFVYDLPSSMNDDIVEYAKQRYGYTNCISLESNGMGDELMKLGENGEMSIRNTDQFSLEVIIHKKLLHSTFRTLNPEEADIFYVPAYVGTHCIFYNKYYFTSLSEQLILNLTDFLQSQKYFKEGKPHFSTISMIHREMCGEFCPYLQYNVTKNITFLAIERETNLNYNDYMRTASQSIIVIPYPSFIHLAPENIIDNRLPVGNLNQRDVYILLPAGMSYKNDFRSKIMDQFLYKTKYSYQEYKNQNKPINMVFFEVTGCDGKTDKNLVMWMQHSVFCLQPPGDSPTRKSFYDSITSGCIPVTFGNQSLQYAFPTLVDYSKFTISIPTTVVDEHNGILNFLQNIDPGIIQQLHENLLSVLKYMQYTILKENALEEPDDAMKLIFAELAKKFVDVPD